jgi:3-hydroxyisobutyrate dehydrogenase-like beta-hydroxyacid dehydrogenase
VRLFLDGLCSRIGDSCATARRALTTMSPESEVRMATISVLGAGRMGAALVTAWIEGGHDVTVWNRTAAKVAPLRARGARSAASLDEAARADVVVGVVSDYEVSEALRTSPGFAGALRGKTYVELTSGTPQQARRSAAWAKENGIDYLDGAIMATPDVIGRPGCTILYAGPTARSFDAHAPKLRALGDGTVHVGVDIGHANALANAILAAGHAENDVAAVYTSLR